VETKKD